MCNTGIHDKTAKIIKRQMYAACKISQTKIIIYSKCPIKHPYHKKQGSAEITDA
jgi:hypothetical protein